MPSPYYSIPFDLVTCRYCDLFHHHYKSIRKQWKQICLEAVILLPKVCLDYPRWPSGTRASSHKCKVYNQQILTDVPEIIPEMLARFGNFNYLCTIALARKWSQHSWASGQRAVYIMCWLVL